MNDKVVRLEKTFNVKPEILFQAIGEGRLFMNCGAAPAKSKIDFREGGKYSLDFDSHGQTIGKYLELSPHSRIVFTWCPVEGTGDASRPCKLESQTEVTIEIQSRGKGSFLKLTHTGFGTAKEAEMHTGGWNHGLGGMQKEIE